MSTAMRVKMVSSSTMMKTAISWIKTASKITAKTTSTVLMTTKTNFD